VQFLRSFIDDNPATVLAVVAANLEATQLLFTDEDQAVAALAPWAQITEDEARAAIVDFKGVAQRDLRWTPEAYANVRDVAVITNPDVADVNLEEAATTTFLDELRDLGMNEMLQIPQG
jgi:hypothetical protein